MLKVVSSVCAIIIISACADSIAPQAKAPIELLIDGQSNAVSPANGAANLYPTTGHVSLNDYYCDWSPGNICYQGTNMVQPTRERSIQSSQAWMLLGDALYRETGRDVIIYNVARGGRTTGLLLTAESFPAVKAAVALHPRICAVLWVQGEAEVNVPTQETYTNMRTMINETRARHPGLTWFVALDSYARAAQMRLITEGVVRRGPDIDSLRVNPAYFEPSGIEFKGQGFQAHADSWLSVIQGQC